MEEVRIVREAIYSTVVAAGRLPESREVANLLGLDQRDVEAAFHALAGEHVVVLRPGTSSLWSAPPFSGVPTSFRVRQMSNGHADRRSPGWYAPCAWDAFGIPAAIKEDVQIEARCAWSGEPLPCGVKNGRAFGDGIIHLEVPARRFWDDILYT